jgi:hypothetical protein
MSPTAKKTKSPLSEVDFKECRGTAIFKFKKEVFNKTQFKFNTLMTVPALLYS